MKKNSVLKVLANGDMIVKYKDGVQLIRASNLVNEGISAKKLVKACRKFADRVNDEDGSLSYHFFSDPARTPYWQITTSEGNTTVRSYLRRECEAMTVSDYTIRTDL